MSGKSGWMNKAGLALAMLLVLSPGLAAASNLGFYIGTGMGWSIPNQSGDLIDAFEPETGINWELIHLGYNFTDNFGIGLQYGSAAGPAVSDVSWGQGYLDFSGRYSFSGNDAVVPYVELGLGQYVYLFMEDEPENQLISDFALGFRLALGTNFYINNFYIAPELSYHFVEYSDWTFEPDGGSDQEFGSDETGDMFLFMFKIGYHFRQ